MMEEHEHNKAADALIDWFKSQDIMPADAGVVMAIVIARCLVEKTRNLEKLQDGIRLHNQLLAVEVASSLR